MKRLKIFTAVFVLMAMIFSLGEAAAEPLRLVRLPIIFRGRQPDPDTSATLEAKISRAVMIPLNDTLKLVDYVNPENSSAELNNIWQKMRAENKKVKLAETMRPLAAKLNADIIICPALLRYSESYMFGGSHMESHLLSDVAAELIIYDRRTDELIDKRTSRHYNDSANKFGKASYLAMDSFDSLLTETQLKKKIMAIK